MNFQQPRDAFSETARNLLLARAERLREKPAGEEQEVFWTAEFPLGGEAYALPLESLIACLPLRLVTSVPLSDTHLTGIVRFQRHILTVMSLAGMLGSPGWRRDPSVMLILALGADRLVAVDCEEIPRSSSLSLNAVAQAREAADSGGVSAVERPGLSPVRLIDISKLFSVPDLRGGHGS